MEHLPGIAQGLNLDYNELKARVDRFANALVRTGRRQEELTPGELAFVESHRDSDFFPEMEVLHEQRRLYPQNGFAAHLLGYTGEVSDAESIQRTLRSTIRGTLSANQVWKDSITIN